MRALVHAVALVLMLPRAALAGLLGDCSQAEDWWLRVRACTEAIESGRWEGAAASWAWSNRAVAEAALGDWLAAFDDHARAVALNPADATAWNNKGNTHAAFREYDRALAAFDRAIALRPDYASALYNRAGVRLTVGAHRAAAEDFSAVIAVEPAFGEARAGRAEARCRLGEVAGSVADRLAAIRLGALSEGQVAAYLRETGYFDAPPAMSPPVPPLVPRRTPEAGLTAWTAAGCP